MRPMWPSGSKRPVPTGAPIVEGQRRGAQLRILLVQLDLGRHALLLDEHGEADRRGARALAPPASSMQFDVQHVAKSIIAA